MHIRAISTLTDWTARAGCWGKAGVCRIFEELRIAGIRDVYWRAFNGGLAMYPSRVAEVQGPQVYDAYIKHGSYPFANRPVHYLREIDFTRYDAIADAVEAADELGVNLHLWYSIYEDEHGPAFQCVFNREHPEYWHMDREGRGYTGTLDWFFEEVREYKLAVVDELLAYPLKGLLLDLVRHNATASADRDGVHRFGYNPQIREAYQEAHGADPLDLPPDDADWLAFKTEVRTSLIREVRERMDRTDTCRELSLMLWPVDYAQWACFDVPSLTAEGSIQMITASSLPYSFRPEEARVQYEAVEAQTNDDRVAILPGIMAYNGLSGAHVDDFVAAAEEAGAPGVMLYEADALVRLGLTPTVRAINAGKATYRRELTATRVSDDDTEIDWATVPVFDDFLFHFGPKPEPTPSEKTSVQLAYNSRDLIVRFACEDHDMEAVLAPIEENAQHQYYVNALGQRSPYYDQNSFSVLLDPEHSHEDFYQLGATPRNERTAATFVDETWNAEWASTIDVTATGWTGVIHVPFASLRRAAPQPDDRWGINLLRGIRGLNEISIWFPISGQKPCSNELGHLRF